MKCARCRCEDYTLWEMPSLNRIDAQGKRLGGPDNPIKDSYCPDCYQVEAAKRMAQKLPL